MWCTFKCILVFIILFQGVSCDSFYILTATANPCPAPFTWDQCITLQRFASNSPSHGSTITLILESGSHSLNSGLSLSNIQNFTMVPQVAGDHPTIDCATGSSTQSFTLSSISHIIWQGITFNECTSTFRTNLHSISFRDLSFANSGITVTDVTDSVQLTNTDFTNNIHSRMVGVRTSTHFQLRNTTFTGEYGIELTKAAEITVEDSVLQQVSQGSLYIGYSDNVNVIRCQFLNNNLGFKKIGGGLYLLAVKLKVKDSIFYNNQALKGAAISADSSEITIDGTNFTSNAAITEGGVLVSTGTDPNITIMNSVFIANTAHNYGAVILCNYFWNIKIVNSFFGSNGNGPIWTSQGRNLLIMNSTFYNNYGNDIGAVSDRDTSNYTISDSSFISNRVSNGKGGAIVKYNTAIVIRGSVFSGNSASQSGGAIYTSGTLLAEETNFTDNVATSHGGAIDTQARKGSVVQVHLTNCQIFNNTATLASGGALHLNGDNSAIYIDRSHFVRNTANSQAGSGGAIHHEGQYTNISVTASSFSDNSASSCGVLDVDNTNHQSVKFSGSTFSSNRAIGNLEGGGVICIRSATISLTSCTFTDNHAALNAGIFNIEDSTVTVDRCSFINNSADMNGGVAYSSVYPTVYTVRLSTFSNNSAERDGGVFYMGMIRSRVNIMRSSFGSNSAKNSGGMIAINGSQLVIDNQTNVYDNTASIGSAISACSSAVTTPSELVIIGSSTGCLFYSGNINRYNISEFIRQEFSTTPAVPTATTTPIITTNASIPTTPFMNGSHTHSHPPVTGHTTESIPHVHTSSPHHVNKPTTTVDQQGSSKGSQSVGGDSTNYAKIAVAISCVSLVLTIGLCGLVGIFLGIKIVFMITKRKSSGSWSHNNQFLLQEDET